MGGDTDEGGDNADGAELGAIINRIFAEDGKVAGTKDEQMKEGSWLLATMLARSRKVEICGRSGGSSGTTTEQRAWLRKRLMKPERWAGAVPLLSLRREGILGLCRIEI